MINLKLKNWFRTHTVTLFFLSTFFICILIYRNSFGSFFFQDDWFTLRISQAKRINEILEFFVPRSDVIYYRPLGMQVVFFFLQSVFKLNPIPYKIIIFIVHLINVYLVYLLMFRILKKRNVALFGSFLYATSAVHFIPFYWFATFPFVLGPLIFNLAAFFYIYFLDKKKYSLLIVSSIFFIIGLFVNEIVISLPVILSIYHLLTVKIKRFLFLIPFYTAAGIIFILRFIILMPPVAGNYHLGLGWHILSNLKTYFFWSFNWSEIATEQMIKPFIFNSLIMDKYSSAAYIFIISFAVFITLFILGLYLVLKSQSPKLELRLIFLGLVWFAAGLMPVLFFTQHKFSYYLPISLAGLLIAVSILYNQVFVLLAKRSKIISRMAALGILYLWVVSTVTAVNLNIKEHWAPRRSNLSRKLLNNSFYNEGMVKVAFSSENRLALNDQDAFKLIYGADTTTVYEK